jgi:hypothetical protein
MKTLLVAGGIALVLAPAPASAQAVDAFYWLMEPPVVLASAPEPVLLTVRAPAPLPTAVTFEPATGAPRAMTAVGPDTWQVEISPTELLFGYLPDDVNRNFAGFVRFTVPGFPDALHNVFVNVLDAQIAPVGVRTLSPDLRCSPHVVNVHVPGADPLGTTVAQEEELRRQAIRRLYQVFPDAFDMVNVVLTLPRRSENRTHVPVKNQVSGIGMSIFDNSAFFGSAGRLLGINRFPLDSVFDLTTTGAVHEIGHQWINWLDHPLLVTGMPHWPPSDMARGVMGLSIPGTGVGGSFPYQFVFQSPGTYLVQSAPVTREFSPLDLYLMGLLPPASVPPFVVSTAPIGDIVPGAIVPGIALTIDEVIASEGPRVPPAVPSLALRLATIVVTRERPLTRAEMAFFDHFAARAELTVSVPFAEGFEKGIAKPFRLATGGRGTLDAKVGCPLPRPTPRTAGALRR